jgi:SHAQKYF class myb-like DNA-binding protein
MNGCDSGGSTKACAWGVWSQPRGGTFKYQQGAVTVSLSLFLARFLFLVRLSFSLTHSLSYISSWIKCVCARKNQRTHTYTHTHTHTHIPRYWTEEEHLRFLDSNVCVCGIGVCVCVCVCESGIHVCRYWTEEEHQRFLDAIQNYGHKDVKAIASVVGTRNATQVFSLNVMCVCVYVRMFIFAYVYRVRFRHT